MPRRSSRLPRNVSASSTMSVGIGASVGRNSAAEVMFARRASIGDEQAEEAAEEWSCRSLFRGRR